MTPCALTYLLRDPLLKFVNESAFAQNGGIVTDLDGTALHEDAERVYIPKAVGRPVGAVFALNLHAGRLIYWPWK
jgi:hypothetical protein